LLGKATSVEISNCFFKNININTQASSESGIGGLIGNYSGKINGCYATGVIDTIASYLGGIFGKTEDSSSICKNCYASVNINTSGTVTIKNNKGKEITDNELIGTGSKVIVELNNQTIEYTLIVSGDTTGDVRVNIADVVKLADHT